MNELIEIIAKRFAVRHGHETPCEGCQHEAKDAINALEESGFRIVPVELTDEMVLAGLDALSNTHAWHSEPAMRNIHRAFLEASPHAAKG